MSSKKKAAGLDALKNLKSDTSEPKKATPTRKATAKPAVTTKPKTPATKTRAKAKAAPSPSTDSKAAKTNFLLALPEEAHEKLRELAFHEKASMTQLVLEGVDYLFESRGLPAVAKPPVDE